MRRPLALLLAGISWLVYIDCHAQEQASVTRDSAETAYAAGVAAFQSGDYALARSDFLEARTAGYKGVQLDYSLAATYYQLGLYEDANREFTPLLHNPPIA